METRDGHHVFEVELFLNDLDPEAVRVELYAEGANGGAGQEMERDRTPSRQCGSGRSIAIGPGGPSRNGLYGASHTALCRGCGTPGSQYHSLAAVSQPAVLPLAGAG